jgi:RNA polymerase sigma-70 factor (ECF subfamily)
MMGVETVSMRRSARQDSEHLGESGFDPEFLLVRAKGGDGAALGRLLERYQNYMGLLVRLQIVRARKSVDIDAVLEGIRLEIFRRTAGFRGVSEQDFLTWLRRVTAAVLANHIRQDLAANRRDLRFERALSDELDRSSFALSRSLGGSQSGSSEPGARPENAVLLADALQELPADYREVIILRQLE